MNEPCDLWNGLWARLTDGVAGAHAATRTLALATKGTDGGAAVRMVVPRGVQQDAQTLTFYTHAGSDKVRELAADPKGELLLWDAMTNFQARLAVTVAVAPGDEALWESLSNGARLNYVPTLEPGAAIEAPHVPDAAGPEAFVVLTAKIHSADILDLSELPHRRAKFKAADDFTGQWVAP